MVDREYCHALAFCYGCSMSNILPTIAVIGGGAAGMMAAATLIESGKPCRVLLFEKNKKLGAKVIISGGGRCNVTTGLTNRQELLKKYTRGGNFLKAALAKFPPQTVYEWFETHGVPLKTEADSRVFPLSDDGHDIVKIFEDLFAQNDSELHLLTSVESVENVGEQFLLQTNRGNFHSDFIIITTGGSAYRHTGSTGDGYAFASALGHTITPVGPSLNSFMIKEEWPKELSGISLADATLKYTKTAVSGPLLFTHFGISGPVTFSLSSHIPYEKISPDAPLTIQLIPLAGKSFQDWEAVLLDTIAQHGKKHLNTFLQTFFPKRLVSALLRLGGIKEHAPLSELSKEKRRALSHLLSGNIRLNLTARRPGDEFVTAGGVSTNEINPQTMESLKTKGLYFGGEVMNVDGVTGGFNLQASWATGRLAAKTIAKELSKKNPSPRFVTSNV